MSAARTPLTLASNLTEVIDTAAGATAQTNVFGAAVTALYLIEVDNRGNDVIVYLKLYNNASPTVGTTAPSLVLPCSPPDANQDDDGAFDGITQLAVPEGLTEFATAVSLAVVTTPGTAGTTAPGEAVTVKLVGTV